MNKSVYSIVLSDDVVAHVDRLAYMNGTSRSNMINQILAEYVSYITPEKRLGDIFSRMAEMISAADQLQVMLGASDTMMSIKSALAYKYNPTVRYSVELYKAGDALGELRVSLRTQSAGLVAILNGFYAMWSELERRELSPAPPSRFKDGKYARILCRPKDAREDDVAKAIVAYVRAMDGAMKGYFSDIAADRDPAPAMDNIYGRYQRENDILL